MEIAQPAKPMKTGKPFTAPIADLRPVPRADGKAERAKRLEVEVISEEQLIAMLDSSATQVRRMR